MSDVDVIDAVAENVDEAEPTGEIVRYEAPLPAKRAAYTPTPDTVIEIWPTSDTCVPMTPKAVADLVCPGIPVKEALRFLLVCRQAGVHPIGKEIYIDKRANDKGGFDYMFVLAQQAWRRLAHQHPEFVGMSYEEFPSDPTKYVVPVMGRCKVWRKGAPEPYVQDVYYEEATNVIGAGGKVYKKGGYAQAQPREFLRGVCEMRACRHAFPDRFSGLYDESEKL